MTNRYAPYPTLQEVEVASTEQCREWSRLLPHPGHDYLGEDGYELLRAYEQEVMAAIIARAGFVRWNSKVYSGAAVLNANWLTRFEVSK